MTTTEPAQILGQLLPELAALDDRETELAAKLARLSEATERHSADVVAWQAASHAAAIAGEPEPEGPPPAPYSDAPLAARSLMDARLEVQRQRRQVLRDRAPAVLAGVDGLLEPMRAAAVAPARKLDALAAQAAPLHAAAAAAYQAAGLPAPALFDSAALARAALGGRPLLPQPTGSAPDPDEPTPADVGIGNHLLQRAQRVA